MTEWIQEFKRHGLHLTPGGIWKFQEGSKVPIDAKRYQNSSWDSFPKDNMAKHFLPEDILVLDIDGAETQLHEGSIEIVDLNLTLPIGLYSQTTNPGK